MPKKNVKNSDGPEGKRGYKVTLRERSLEWLEDFEKATGVTKTRLTVAAFLALSTRNESERARLFQLATLVDLGDIGWDQALATMIVDKGRIDRLILKSRKKSPKQSPQRPIREDPRPRVAEKELRDAAMQAEEHQQSQPGRSSKK